MSDPRGILLFHQRVYRGRVVTLDVDRVRLPNGHEGSLEVVRHRGSVVLVPMPDGGHVLMVRQYRYAVDRWIWELPAGVVERDEAVERAAARECEEEVGLVPGRIDQLGTFYPTPGFCDEQMALFRLTDLRPPDADSTARRDPDEDLEVRAFAVGELWAMIDRGEIVDAKTVLGLSLSARR